MTLKMTTAQVVETSVTVTNSSFQNYTHPDDHTTQTINKSGAKYDHYQERLNSLLPLQIREITKCRENFV